MATSFVIKNNDLMNLTNDSFEIRSLTLKKVLSTFHGASMLMEKVDVDGVLLIKQLIRWFGFHPVELPLYVLSIMQHVFSKPDLGPSTIRSIGTERLLREMDKVRYTLKGHQDRPKAIDKIQSIKRVLSQTLKDLENSSENSELPQLLEMRSISKPVNNETRRNPGTNKKERSLGKPLQVDYDAMQIPAEILVNPLADAEQIENVIQHLQITLCDYPVDFLLQAPYIFRNLLFLYDERDTTSGFHCQPTRRAASTLLTVVQQFYRTLSINRKSIAHFVTSNKSSSSSRHRFTTMRSPSSCRNLIENALRQIITSSCAHLELHLDDGHALAEVWEILYSILKLYEIFELNITAAAFDLKQILKMIDKLQMNFALYECCTRSRLCQMQLLFLLKDILKISFQQNHSMEPEVCLPMVKDYVIKCILPKQYEEHRLLTFRTQKSLHPHLLALDRYEKAFQYAIDMLMKPSTIERTIDIDCIAKYTEICLIMDKLQSKLLFDRIFDHIVACNHLYCKNSGLLVLVKELLQGMLLFQWLPLKVHVYSKLEMIIKQFIGCLMSGEAFSMICLNTTLLENQIVGVPLSIAFLEQLLYEANAATTENSDDVKTHCFEIIGILLKSHNLFGKYWINFLQLLMPILPLLSCCVQSKDIMDILVKLYNPDYKALPSICILRGNISFLFHDNVTRRTEALNRLIYILNTDQESHKLIPNMLDIKNMLTHDLCYGMNPRELKDIFSSADETLNEDIRIALKNLCYLLDTTDVEPLTRKTTLIQINVLCSSWWSTIELGKLGAEFLILHALQNALQRSSTKEYPDAVEPAISCLAKILLCDANTRYELAEKPNIYVFLLRAMMLLTTNIKVRQDASICLFLLLYTKTINVTMNRIEGVDLLERVKQPIKMNFVSSLLKRNKSEEEKLLKELFKDLDEEQMYWRLVIAERFNKSLENITLKTIKDQQVEMGDINPQLQLTRLDIRWIRFSQPILCTQKLLQAISNATEHHALIQAATVIKSHLLFYRYGKINNFPNTMEMYLWRLLSRFIQLRPGNEEDIELFEHTLDVIILCIRAKLSEIIKTLIDSLNRDKLHALITMLIHKKAEEIPLHIYYKITVLLKELFEREQEINPKCERKLLIGELIDMLVQNTLVRFTQRDLHRVRCLLQIIVTLSKRHDLIMSDEILLRQCKSLFYITKSLKTITQTGAQLHRDCLSSILYLSGHMKQLSEVFCLPEEAVNYLSNLCGHIDAEIRILAWSLLHMISEGYAPQSSINQKEGMKKDNPPMEEVSSKHRDQSSTIYVDGSHLLLMKLKHLPGGFLACCLSTFLDTEELICVRVLAGLLFSSLVTHKENNLDKSLELLDKCRFLDIGLRILRSSSSSNCILSTDIPSSSNEYSTSTRNIITCDLIGCFANICSTIGLQSVKFIQHLCEHNFLCRLYEVMKRSLPETLNPIIYLRMVADICRVYILCTSNYSNNFGLLQRTICRDAVWLRGLCYILFIQQDIEYILKRERESGMLVDILTLFMALLKDSMAFEQIAESICSMPKEFTQFFTKIFAISEVGNRVQSQALSALTILLIKSQPERVNEGNTSGILSILTIEETKNSCTMITKSQSKENLEEDTSKTGKTLCISLIRLLTHLYPLKMCKFEISPTTAQQQVVECLALLLKISTQAQQSADALKLKDKITRIFQQFLDEFSIYTCTTYIRRCGETKKNAIIKNLLLLMTFLLHWFSSPTTMITDDLWAETISKILIQIWQWLVYSANLKLTVFQLCAFLSEKSFVIIRKFSILNTSSFQHSILQLIVKTVCSETMKVKTNITEYTPTIITGLRVLMNCCACVEGRTLLQKAHILDIIDTIHPFNPKAPRLRGDIVRAWLQFWELFTRYEEGASANHLPALCEVINRQEPYSEIRLYSIQILRNMAFLDKNRTALITSKDFIYTALDIISQTIDSSTPSYEEQWLLATALWKIVSGGIKNVSLIRGTRLAKQLRILEETIQTMSDECKDLGQYSMELLQILHILRKIFANS